ncbi:MAG TPA: AgmX/PglI C-terminal domain-containing protein [Polyangiaceae bacterium]|nr:AgmX/PglI C-terminal domain-containing protein [Polyangiaceae bacterium]
MDEMEKRGKGEVIEISLAWGDSVLSLIPLGTRRELWIGESRPDGRPSDVFLPEEVLGCARHKLLSVDELGSLRVHPPAAAQGWLRTPDSAQFDIHSLPEHFVPSGARVHLDFGAFALSVRSLGRAPRVPRGLPASEWKAPLAYFGSSLAVFAGVLGSLAFFVPPLGLSDDGDIDKDRLVLLKQYMEASAARELERPEPEARQESTSSPGAAAGQAATGSSGTMGKPTPTPSQGRFSVPDRSADMDAIARQRAIAEARNWGMLGLLNASTLGDVGPVAPWGGDRASGHDPLGVEGSMWADTIGEATGSGGLGLSGPGDGGGGLGRGIGITNIGTGIGPGTGGPGTWGTGKGISNGTHATRVLPIHTAPPEVSGHLPAEVIQRTVRQNFGRFRMCYQAGLSRNPGLEGRVAVRFVIDRRGSVSNVGLAGSGLPDAAVNDCLKLAFYGLSFTAPENGIVQVTYPLLFSPE